MNKKPFKNKWKKYLWPIEKGEYNKFIPMLLLFFFVSFIYNILRAAKDTLVITAPASGAETIPFIKVWVMLPMALFLTCIFTRLSNRYGLDKVFYSMISIFLGFFTIFTFVLYPLKELLHPTATADMLSAILPAGFKGLIAIFRNWTFTAFYVMSELWGTSILTVLFWGVANEVFDVKEAKRFYILFGLGANISGIFAGRAAMLLSSNHFHAFIPFGKTAWEQSVLYMNLTVIGIGFLIIAIFRFLHQNVIRKQNFAGFQLHLSQKPKMSLKENFSYLAKSKYLIFLALIVVTYNIAINLVEVLWKNQVKQLFPNPSEYNAYMGQVMILMGILATIAALFISGNILRKCSWTFSAMIPPAIVIGTGVIFFSFFFFKNHQLLAFSSLFGSTPLALSVFFGTLQNCMSRASKYTLFDATKEIAFIPLTADYKLKGKAAIDGVGSRFGKSGGSIIHQSLLIIFSSLSVCAPYVAGIFIIIGCIWIFSVKALGKKFYQLASQKEKAPVLAHIKEDPVFATTTATIEKEREKVEEVLKV